MARLDRSVMEIFWWVSNCFWRKVTLEEEEREAETRNSITENKTEDMYREFYRAYIVSETLVILKTMILYCNNGTET